MRIVFLLYAACTEQLVSSDFQQLEVSCIVDVRWLHITNNRLLRFMLWYDNEWGYSSRSRLSLVCLNILLTVMEVVGLLIGKDKSMGVPGKNVRLMLGRPMCEYGFIAGKAAGVSNLFVSTDSEQIAQVGSKYDAIHIPRPLNLQHLKATEDVLKHAYSAICKHLNRSPDVVILLFANNPAINMIL